MYITALASPKRLSRQRMPTVQTNIVSSSSWRGATPSWEPWWSQHVLTGSALLGCGWRSTGWGPMRCVARCARVLSAVLSGEVRCGVV